MGLHRQNAVNELRNSYHYKERLVITVIYANFIVYKDYYESLQTISAVTTFTSVNQFL